MGKSILLMKKAISMSIYKKLQEARVILHKTHLNKSGKNKFAGFSYFELADFIPQVTEIFNKIGLCGVVSFTHDTAYLTVHETEGDGFISFTSPLVMAENAKGQAIQSLGSTHTYYRRYLWLMCMEIIENDVIDAGEQGSTPLGKSYPNSAPVTGTVTVNVKPNDSKVTVTKTPEAKKIVGQAGEWQIVAPAKPDGDTKEWLELIKSASHMLLDLTSNEEDVMLIFKKNKSLFDTVKATDPVFFKDMMGKFTERKTMFTK
jgi:hypothetical protein